RRRTPRRAERRLSAGLASLGRDLTLRRGRITVDPTAGHRPTPARSDPDPRTVTGPVHPPIFAASGERAEGSGVARARNGGGCRGRPGAPGSAPPRAARGRLPGAPRLP